MCVVVCRALEARLSAQAAEVDKSASAVSAREMQLTQREASLDHSIQLDKSTRSGIILPVHTHDETAIPLWLRADCGWCAGLSRLGSWLRQPRWIRQRRHSSETTTHMTLPRDVHVSKASDVLSLNVQGARRGPHTTRGSAGQARVRTIIDINTYK